MRVPPIMRAVEGTRTSTKGPVDVAPDAGGEMGSCPDGESPAVVDAWDRISSEVAWLSQVSDRSAMLDLCRLVVEADRAYKRVRRGDPEGVHTRRWLALSESVFRRLRAFGMTPVDSSRLMVREKPVKALDDPLGLRRSG